MRKLYKSLCLATAVTTAFVGMAEVKTPVTYDGASFQKMSANGRYVVSELLGIVTVYDLTEGTSLEFAPDENYENYYYLGHGNCITADGKTIVGSTIENGTASYLVNGEWHNLEVQDYDMINSANGITADGSRICGCIGLNAMTMEDVIMQIPAYWDRNADGTYGEYKILPHPEQDFFGQKPQYVSAIAISNDGKTIVGQMTFNSGFYVCPVVYTQDDKGEWSYSLPTEALFNPDKIEPVENPGDGPDYPTYEGFISQAGLEAYEAAETEWYASQPNPDDFATEDEYYTAINEWYDSYPSAFSFMTEEEIAALEAAKAEYEEWSLKFDEYLTYMNEVIESSPNFLYNNVMLSTDGKKLVATVSRTVPNDDPMSWMPFKEVNTPCTIDIATGEFSLVDTELSISACGAADNGVILAVSDIYATPMTGYIIKDGAVQTVAEYITSVSPELGTWINENMKHEVVTGGEYDEVAGEWIEYTEELLFVGMPVATPDLGIIAVWTMAEWNDYFVEGTVFDLASAAGVSAIAAEGKNLQAGKNGSVIVPAGFASLEVYNVGGKCVKTVAAPCGTVELGLGNGVYIVKGTRTNGTTSVIKVVK